MEGKILVKSLSGSSKAWDYFGFYKNIESQISVQNMEPRV